MRKAISRITASVIIAIILIAVGLLVVYLTQQPTGTKTTPYTVATSSPTSTVSTQTVSTPATKKIKVAVLFDVGGRGDLSFNDMAVLGAEKAKKDFGVEIVYQTPRSSDDMVPLLESLSKSGEYDLLVLIGFLWTRPLNETADKYPNQKYALIDSTTGVVRPNEVDVVFREQEVGALIGVIASGMAQSLNSSIVGAVAGMSVPPLWKFHIGYLFGIKYFEKATGKKIDLIWQYTGKFTDPQAGYNAGWNELEQGATVIYGLAGLTHVGMFNAVIDWNKQGRGKAFAIGQDASQEWYAPQYIPVSGSKRVDVGVYDVIKMVVENNWRPGILSLGVKEGGVGVWDLDGVRYFAEIAYETGKLKDLTPDQVVKIVNETRNKYIPQYVWDIVNNLKKLLEEGRIEFKTPSNESEYNAIISALLKGDLNAALSKGSV